MGEMKNTKNFSWKAWSERSLGKPRRRWEYNIRLDLWKIGLEGWIGFNRLRIGTGGGYYEHGIEPTVFIKGGNLLAS
jgi:hypothetical protein